MSMFETEVLPLFEITRQPWLERARATARYLARKNGRVTIDDVRAECPPPPDVDPRVMGSVLTSKHFEKIGSENSTRRTCHQRPVAVFKLRGAT